MVELPVEAKKGLSEIGLDGVFNSLWLAAESFVNSEKALRMVGRLSAVEGLVLSGDEETAETKYNEAGIAHLGNALSQLAQARAQLYPGVIQRLDKATRTDDFRGTLARARTNFMHQLSSQDIQPNDFREIIGIWNSKMGIAANGVSGVLDDLHATIGRVRELRLQPNRGREAGSPLPLWKAILITTIIVIDIGAVIVCFVFLAALG